MNIGGVTLHSWAGIGINYENPKKTPEEVGRELGGKMLGQPAFSRAKKRWENVQALIVDESTLRALVLVVFNSVLTGLDGVQFRCWTGDYSMCWSLWLDG